MGPAACGVEVPKVPGGQAIVIRGGPANTGRLAQPGQQRNQLAQAQATGRGSARGSAHSEGKSYSASAPSTLRGGGRIERRSPGRKLPAAYTLCRL